jgi:hypothetical protein
MVRSVLAVIFFLLAPTAVAQNSPGTITGTVTNPDNAIIAGVQVQATHVATGTVYKTDSSRIGVFALSQLSAGTYELSVYAIGFTFAPYVKRDLLVQAGQTLRADIRLEWPINLGTVGDDSFLTIRNRYAGLSGPAPRTSDDKPDLSGIWNGSGDPNPEPPSLLAWAADIQKQRLANNLKDLPTAYCLPGEVFPSAPLLHKIVQTPLLLVQLTDADYRQIFLDGRGHPADPDPKWRGHSIGKWEGDSLIIDTVGFNDKSWLPAFLPHTEMLHVIERYRRPDLAHLTIDVSIEDSGTFAKPWQLHMVWTLAPGEEIQEAVCENNKYRENTGSK